MTLMPFPPYTEFYLWDRFNKVNRELNLDPRGYSHPELREIDKWIDEVEVFGWEWNKTILFGTYK